MATNRIIKFNLEADAWRLRGQPDLSEATIAKKLTELSGEKISRSTVNRYFKGNKDPIIARIAQREEVVQAAITERLDTVAQLREINDKATTILNATQTDDPRIALLAIREIREQIALQAKLLGDLPADGAVTINILQNPLFVEFQTIVEEVMCPVCRDRLRARLRELARP